MRRTGFVRTVATTALFHACGCNASATPPPGWGDDTGASSSPDAGGAVSATYNGSSTDSGGSGDAGSGQVAPKEGGAPATDAGGGATADAGADAATDGASARPYTTGVLVFTGDGAWGTEIADLEALLDANGVTYQEATSPQLDAMTSQDMAAFGVIYIPGGEGDTEALSVSADTHANLRAAVQQLGVSYVGFCAGAFIAVAPAPPPGGDVSYGFGVVNGLILDLYAGPGTDSEYEQTLESYPDGSCGEHPLVRRARDARHRRGRAIPDGQPAISQSGPARARHRRRRAPGRLADVARRARRLARRAGAGHRVEDPPSRADEAAAGDVVKSRAPCSGSIRSARRTTSTTTTTTTTTTQSFAPLRSSSLPATCVGAGAAALVLPSGRVVAFGTPASFLGPSAYSSVLAFNSSIISGSGCSSAVVELTSVSLFGGVVTASSVQARAGRGTRQGSRSTGRP